MEAIKSIEFRFKNSKPAVLTSINTSPNQSAILDHESYIGWGAGIHFEMKW